MEIQITKMGEMTVESALAVIANPAGHRPDTVMRARRIAKGIKCLLEEQRPPKAEHIPYNAQFGLDTSKAFRVETGAKTVYLVKAGSSACKRPAFMFRQGRWRPIVLSSLSAMGRSGIDSARYATDADFAEIPEPPENWEETLGKLMQAGLGKRPATAAAFNNTGEKTVLKIGDYVRREPLGAQFGTYGTVRTIVDGIAVIEMNCPKMGFQADNGAHKWTKIG